MPLSEELCGLDRRAKYVALATFVPRRPELLALEGWYEYETVLGLVRFKLTCRFRDFLRCSVWRGHPKHFTSCFAPGGAFWYAPLDICRQQNIAMVYLPDKHGNFQARAWVRYSDVGDGWPELHIHRMYGNGLDGHEIAKVYNRLDLACSAVEWDIDY